MAEEYGAIARAVACIMDADYAGQPESAPCSDAQSWLAALAEAEAAMGDVMKESATIALEWVKAHGEELGIDREKFEKFDVNIHVPEGAIPKDGPSAGITMVTSLVSTFTGRPVRDRVAMTGETTLRGRVLPVGGIKEKILAAKRAGIREIVLSEENRKDISEIKPEYLEGLTFH